MGMDSVPKRGDLSIMQTPLPVELQGQIGQRLREAYNELVNEPVPDRFVLLLQQLKKSEGNGHESSGGKGGQS
jgi:hypothetical protein